ncbi:MAG TPA: DUF521 domain-containing protein [Christensenellaceae bacterium]|jgi:predicted aconitase|nr:DUF521 domain-containing protein [Christensenellaceae bacterium]
MKLTQYEADMAAGKFGPGLQKAINLLIRYGDACGAEEFVEITSGHVMPKEPPELLEQFIEGVEKLPVMTTLHPLMSAFSPEKWEEMGISKEYAEVELQDYYKRSEMHTKLGFLKTYSCLPMNMGNLPRIGDYISWIGSCAQILANSMLGARTNKDGTVVSLCAALTGRTPKTGLLLDENRFATVLVTMEDGLELNDDSDYGAMGYFIGMQVANKSIAVEGLPRTVTFDQLKYLIAPAAASGSIHVFHVIGVTPEALTKQAAFGGKEPQSIIKVSRKDIEATKKIFAFNKNKEVDLLLLGCPHITIQEAGTISDFLKNRKLKQGKRLWLAMGKPVYTLAKTMGFADNIEAAGGVISDTCLATIPDSPIPKDVKVVLTNSFKCAHYVRSLQKDQVEVMVAGLHDCLESITEKVGEVQ